MSPIKQKYGTAGTPAVRCTSLEILLQELRNFFFDLLQCLFIKDDLRRLIRYIIIDHLRHFIVDPLMEFIFLLVVLIVHTIYIHDPNLLNGKWNPAWP